MEQARKAHDEAVRADAKVGTSHPLAFLENLVAAERGTEDAQGGR